MNQVNPNNPDRTEPDVTGILHSIASSYASSIAKKVDDEVKNMLDANGIYMQMRDYTPEKLREKGYVMFHDVVNGVHTYELLKIVDTRRFKFNLDLKIQPEKMPDNPTNDGIDKTSGDTAIEDIDDKPIDLSEIPF